MLSQLILLVIIKLKEYMDHIGLFLNTYYTQFRKTLSSTYLLDPPKEKPPQTLAWGDNVVEFFKANFTKEQPAGVLALPLDMSKTYASAVLGVFWNSYAFASTILQ